MTRPVTPPPPPPTPQSESTTTTDHPPPSLPNSPLAKRTKPNNTPSIPSTTPTMTNSSAPVTSLSTSPPLLIKKLSPKAQTPTRGSAFAAGYDIYSAHDTVIPARGKALVDTDLAIAVPAGTCTFSLLVAVPVSSSSTTTTFSFTNPSIHRWPDSSPQRAGLEILHRHGRRRDRRGLSRPGQSAPVQPRGDGFSDQARGSRRAVGSGTHIYARGQGCGGVGGKC